MPVQDLLEFIDASPTPFHAVAETAARLEARGYRRLEEADAWDVAPGDKVYLVRGGGSLAAFHLGQAASPEAGFRLVGAHTDSPNLRVKPNPSSRNPAMRSSASSPTAACCSTPGSTATSRSRGERFSPTGAARLVRFDRPLLRVPSLAIHLNRTVNSEGLKLNAQKHMAPILALDGLEGTELRELVAD